MYDPDTARLIRTAPALEGLDLENLPRKLTEAFAEVVSARIRLQPTIDSEPSEEERSDLAELRRLGFTYEAYVALLPDRENRSAAAFVAASAHQACAQRLRTLKTATRIDASSVAPAVCTALLFLVAESHADALEAAKKIDTQPEGSSAIERALLESINDLASGRLAPINRRDAPPVDKDAEMSERAVQSLLLMLFTGIKSLAQQIRRRTDLTLELGGVEPAATIFQRVRRLCVEPIDGVLDTEDQAFSLYSGPLHLANLLITVERDLLGSALTRIPAPDGVAEDGWWHVLRRMARYRPFLWRNHRKAIAEGYLQPGTSSAISFPTGAGKSTLAELKIATALLRGEKVIFLAPTNALVGQTTRALQGTFNAFNVVGEVDDDANFGEIYVLPNVMVTTPERCLMLLSMQPEAFERLGLIVFDECHLLHPREEDRSRRGLDAMLTILGLTNIAPGVDLLMLSAMMQNTAEIAGWLKSLTGRECLTLDLSWKPTRQVRGCVVFPNNEIDALNEKLKEARRKHPTQASAPTWVQKQLNASPFGFFGLLQTWSTKAREDYALLPLLSSQVLLTTRKATAGRVWSLTPNGNETSGAIAAAAVTAGMKTLVFVQSAVIAESCVKGFPDRQTTKPITLTDEENAWRQLSVEEMGGEEYCYLNLDKDGVLRTSAAGHHSFLLREERDLHESLFKRRDGIGVLFATSTLAQGMNLPSEVVVISGDMRFDPGVEKMKQLEAHELLNAAGRAGRAGEGAEGFVLLVPSKVIPFDDEKSTIGSHWMDLQTIFQQADQCLVIDDPIQVVLDQIHNGITKGGAPAYLLSKLPVSIGSDGEDPGVKMLKRSFAAYRATAAGDTNWVDTRIKSAMTARVTVELEEKDQWIRQIAGSTGLSIKLLQEILDLADRAVFDGTGVEVVEALLKWLKAKPTRLLEFVRPENLDNLLGDKYKKLATDKERAAMALPTIAQLWPLWMSGVPLCQIETAFLGKASGLGKCRHARHFATRIAGDLAFLAGLPARLLTARAKAAGVTPTTPTVLATLGSAVREGCDGPESLAVRLNSGRSISRVAARRQYDDLKPYIMSGSATEDLDAVRERIREALVLRPAD
jgi:superfamily II DNA/RNA helicase